MVKPGFFTFTKSEQMLPQLKMAQELAGYCIYTKQLKFLDLWQGTRLVGEKHRFPTLSTLKTMSSLKNVSKLNVPWVHLNPQANGRKGSTTRTPFSLTLQSASSLDSQKLAMDLTTGTQTPGFSCSRWCQVIRQQQSEEKITWSLICWLSASGIATLPLGPAK